MQVKPLVLFIAAGSAAVLPRDDVGLSQWKPVAPFLIRGSGDDAGFGAAALYAPPEHFSYTTTQLDALNSSTSVSPPFDPTPRRTSAVEGQVEERGGVWDGESRFVKGDTSYPWSAMGRVIAILPDNWMGVCTGTMVGPRHLVLARHCLDPKALEYRFQPAFYQTDRLGTFKATSFHTLDDSPQDVGNVCTFQSDYAILVLERDPGHGYLGVKPFQDDMAGKALDWWNFGYPGDKGGVTPYAQNRFGVEKQCVLATKADSSPGQSGGPLWIPESDGRWLYGVLSGTTSSYTAFAFGDGMLQLLNRVRQQHP